MAFESEDMKLDDDRIRQAEHRKGIIPDKFAFQAQKIIDNEKEIKTACYRPALVDQLNPKDASLPTDSAKRTKAHSPDL